MKSILFYICIFISTNAMAGVRDVGNGGVSVQCFNSAGEITSIEILDHLEARVLYGMETKLGPENLSLNEKLEISFKRIERLNPIRANRYRKAISSWALANIIFQNESMPLQDDTTPIFVPKNCKLLQVALRTSPLNDTDRTPELTIQKDIWQKLSFNEQAILILHELLYWENEIGDSRGTEGSLPARQLNALIFSGKIESMTIEEYLNISKIYHLPDVEYKGLNFDPNRAVFYSNGNLKYISKSLFSDILLGSYFVQGKQVQIYRSATFYEDGTLLETTILPGENHPVELKTYRGNLYVRNNVRFDKAGIVKSFGDLSLPGTIRIGNSEVYCSEPDPQPAPYFYTIAYMIDDSEKNIGCWVKKDQIVDLPNAKFITLNDGYIFLNDKGIHWSLTTMPRYQFQIASLKGKFIVPTINGDLELSELNSYIDSSHWVGGWSGKLVKPILIKFQNKYISVHQNIRFEEIYAKNKRQVTYAEPEKDFMYYNINVASSFNCSFLNPSKKQAAVQFFYDSNGIDSFLSYFVLASNYKWKLPDNDSLKVQSGNFVRSTLITNKIAPKTVGDPCHLFVK